MWTNNLYIYSNKHIPLCLVRLWVWLLHQPMFYLFWKGFVPSIFVLFVCQTWLEELPIDMQSNWQTNKLTYKQTDRQANWLTLIGTLSSVFQSGWSLHSFTSVFTCRTTTSQENELNFANSGVTTFGLFTFEWTGNPWFLNWQLSVSHVGGILIKHFVTIDRMNYSLPHFKHFWVFNTDPRA